MGVGTDTTLHIDGAAVAVRTTGPADGWPLIFVAGTPNSRLVAPAERIAATADVRVVTFDRPGYGQSDETDDTGWQATGRLVNKLAQRLELRACSIAAWSAGAGHALAAAARLGDRCRSVGLVAPLGPIDLTECRRALPRLSAARLSVLRRLPPQHRRRAIARALTKTATDAHQHPSHRWQQLMDRAAPPDRSALMTHDVEATLRADIEAAFRQGGRGWFRDVEAMCEPWPESIFDLTTPTRIWHGEQDHDVGVRSGEVLADRLPDAILERRPDAGHYLLFDIWPELLEHAARAGETSRETS